MRGRGGECLIGNGSQLEVNSRLNWKLVELVKERTGMGLTVCLKYNAAKRILGSLKFGNSGFGSSIENRVCVVHQLHPGKWKLGAID